jgi:hypothetical protein
MARRVNEKEAVEVPCLLIRGGEDNEDANLRHYSSTLIIYSHANSEDLGTIRPVAEWISHA